MTSWALSALADHLWQSTLFAIAVGVAAHALRHNGARVRFWLWVAASAKFLIPLSLLMSVGQQIQWRDAPDVVHGTASFVVEGLLAPTTGVVELPQALPHSTPLLPGLLLACWAAGAAVVLASWWRQWLPIRAALRRAAPVRLNGQHEAADLIVMSSPSMPEPGVVGILRPRLILPTGIVERLTPAQLRAVIVHERCHIRCYDNITAAIHMVVEAIFWFHPAVWWIEARLVNERERACDEAVLQSGGRPQDYAEGILEVCRQSVGVRLACVAGVSSSNLRARVEAIMRREIGRPMTRRRQFALAAAAVATVGGPIAGGALTAQSQAVVPPALRFESASITPRNPLPRFDARVVAMETRMQKALLGGRDNGDVQAWGPLHSLIQVAYGVSDSQVEGGPSWVHTDSYAIKARAADSATLDERLGMLQSFLAERFKLTLRRETRTLPVYELVAADAGIKITPMSDGECVQPAKIRWDLIDLEAPLYPCGGFRRRALSQSPETRPRPRWPRVDRIEAGGILISGMIDLVSGELDRVVVDRTGFTAPFNLLLDFAAATQPGSPFISSGPSIFEALEDQLGLQLRPAEAPLDVLVIESAAPPSDAIAGL